MINRIYILFLLVPVFHILGMLISRSWTIFPQNVYILQMLTGKMKHLQNKKEGIYYNFFEIYRAHYIETISKNLCNVLKILWQFHHKMKLCYSVIDE